MIQESEAYWASMWFMRSEKAIYHFGKKNYSAWSIEFSFLSKIQSTVLQKILNQELGNVLSKEKS